MATFEKAKVKGLYPDGIYFGMPNDDYHADEALGSTGIKQLFQMGAFEYWYGSALNPKRPKDKPKDPLKVGSAYHAIVLEGEDEFLARFARRADDADNATPAEKASLTKACKAAAEKNGRELLTGDDYDRALAAKAMIALNPELEGAFENGYPEVSVFFTRDGIRQKVRFDYLKLRGFGDLKSVANERRRPIARACGYAISDYRIDMSMAHYLRGRSLMPDLLKEGRVFGDHDSDWLKKLCATKTYAAQLVFIQKSGAPLVWSRTLSPKNPMILTAGADCETGLRIYADAMAKYGRDKMWAEVEPVSELDPDDLPSTFFYQKPANPAA